MSMPENQVQQLRRLPSVDHVLQSSFVQPLLDEFAREEVKLAVQAVLAQRRSGILAAHQSAHPAVHVASDSNHEELSAIALEIRQELYRRRQPNLRRVINATGVVLHTGLGRAPLPQAALDAILETAGGYCNLELNLEDNTRGDRHAHVAGLLRELTGAEDAMVVNNNAAATFLALQALAAGREVVVSRGELVEIGGSYRLPDIMAAAGCRLVEVGTTNRTHLFDYDRAIGLQTAALMRVHTSNYRVKGFTAGVSTIELRRLLDDACAPQRTEARPLLIDDLGSGLLSRDIAEQAAVAAGAAAWDEPDVRSSVAAGADLVLFSGDKLLGGPQAGIAAGRREVIARMKRSPIARAVRPDKLALAALETTLRLHRDSPRLFHEIPTLRMLAGSPAELRNRAEKLASECRHALPDANISVRDQSSYAGGGSLPTLALPTYVVAIKTADTSAEWLQCQLRAAETPVLCRVADDQVLLDCRTIEDGQICEVAAALASVGAQCQVSK